MGRCLQKSFYANLIVLSIERVVHNCIHSRLPCIGYQSLTLVRTTSRISKPSSLYRYQVDREASWKALIGAPSILAEFIRARQKMTGSVHWRAFSLFFLQLESDIIISHVEDAAGCNLAAHYTPRSGWRLRQNTGNAVQMKGGCWKFCTAFVANKGVYKTPYTVTFLGIRSQCWL